MNVFDNIVRTFKQGNALVRLIFVNVAVFVTLKFISIVATLLALPIPEISDYLAMPASFKALMYHAWTPATYMFLHTDFFHLLFNMVALYWFAKIFLFYFSEKQLVGVYIIGGLLGALFYLLAFNIFPFYTPLISRSLMLGASGSVLAIITASAVQSPNMELRMLLLGNVKLKYVALFYVAISFFGLTTNNAGGQLAHLGGAFAGYLFVSSIRNSKDITKGISKIFDFLLTLFRPRKMKVKYSQTKTNSRMSDADYNMNKAKKMAQIDHILDKIKSSGYESLSADEKRQLFEQSNKK